MLRFIIIFFMFFPYFALANDNNTQKVYDCVIVPSNVSELGSQVRGIISSIAVDRNDVVKAGDTIAQLDDKVEQAMVALASQKASLKSELKLTKARLAHAKREMARAQKAYRNKALSVHDYDMTKVQVELEQINLMQAKEKLLIAQKELDHAKAKQENKIIRAPFSGVVTERLKAVGEYINDEPVVRLAQLDPLYAEVIVPVAQRGQIKVGMQAKVCEDVDGQEGWYATVSQVDQVMDARSGTFGVRLTLSNPDYSIPAGIRCGLKFYQTRNIKRPIKIAQKESALHD